MIKKIRYFSLISLYQQPQKKIVFVTTRGLRKTPCGKKNPLWVILKKLHRRTNFFMKKTQSNF